VVTVQAAAFLLAFGDSNTAVDPAF
jgi:hypothetical protein